MPGVGPCLGTRWLRVACSCSLAPLAVGQMYFGRRSIPRHPWCTGGQPGGLIPWLSVTCIVGLEVFQDSHRWLTGLDADGVTNVCSYSHF